MKLHSAEDVPSGAPSQTHLPDRSSLGASQALLQCPHHIQPRCSLRSCRIGEKIGSPRRDHPNLDWSTKGVTAKQFKYCARAEIGCFAPKHIVSKFTVDGFEKEEEEEERLNPQTRRQLERMHLVFRNNLLMCTMAFPQFWSVNCAEETATFGNHLIFGRVKCVETDVSAHGRCHVAILKSAFKSLKDDQLFWSREVYERILFQQLRPTDLKGGKGKGKGKGKTKGGKYQGVYQDHLKTSQWTKGRR